MPFYTSSEQLYGSLKLLFNRIKDQDPQITRSLSTSRLIIRIRTTNPRAEVQVNGRQSPFQISFGSQTLRPDLDVELPADSLHQILLAELPLRKAIGSGQMKVYGLYRKAFALEGIFHAGQAIYPQILQEQGLDGHQPGIPQNQI